MLLIFFCQSQTIFVSTTEKKICRPICFHKKKHIYPQQIHLDAVMHFSWICGKASTRRNELPLKLRKHFANDSFPGKKSAKSPSGSVENTCDNRADSFLSKFHCFKFFKRFRSIFERNHQTVKIFFRKETISLKKFLETDQTHFWQPVGDSSPKYDNSPLKSRKKFKNIFFSKKTFSLKTFIWAQGRLCDYHAKKRQKKLKVRWMFQKNFSLGHFSGKQEFPQKSLRKLEVQFWQLCWQISAKNQFFSQKFNKNCARIVRKVTNCLVFQETNFTWRNGSRELKNNVTIFWCFLQESEKKSTKNLEKTFKTLIYPEKESFLW